MIQALAVKAAAGDAQAQWELGSLLDGGLLDTRGETFVVRPNKRAALTWFRCSAEAGNPGGQICLGNFLSARGEDKQAMSWYRRAALQGDSCAACNIARSYENKRNQRRAFFWYQ